MTTPALPVSPTLAKRLAGTPRLILLDVDGTLAPIAPTPSDAAVPDETRRIVAELALQPDVHVAIVTGRAAADAMRMVGVDGVWFVGNHGFEIVTPTGEFVVDDRVGPYLERMTQAATRLSPLGDAVRGVIVEDKRFTMSIHYRLVDRAAVQEVRHSVESVAKDLGLRTVDGKEILELRPPVAVDKGTAVVSLAGSLGALETTASVLYAGDDVTDEDAFRALRRIAPRSVTIRVGADGGVATAAEYSLKDTKATREFLEWLLMKG
jgi:trehalose 6-phosphate phosphatase